MITLKNKTPWPFDIETKNGPARIAAYGELTADLDAAYVAVLETGGHFEISEVKKPEKVSKK